MILSSFPSAQECTDSLLDQLDQQLKITEDECKDYRDFLEKLSRGSEESIDEEALNRELKQVCLSHSWILSMLLISNLY